MLSTRVVVRTEIAAVGLGRSIGWMDARDEIRMDHSLHVRCLYRECSSSCWQLALACV